MALSEVDVFSNSLCSPLWFPLCPGEAKPGERPVPHLWVGACPGCGGLAGPGSQHGSSGSGSRVLGAQQRGAETDSRQLQPASNPAPARACQSRLLAEPRPPPTGGVAAFTRWPRAGRHDRVVTRPTGLAGVLHGRSLLRQSRSLG